MPSKKFPSTFERDTIQFIRALREISDLTEDNLLRYLAKTSGKKINDIVGKERTDDILPIRYAGYLLACDDFNMNYSQAARLFRRKSSDTVSRGVNLVRSMLQHDKNYAPENAKLGD